MKIISWNVNSVRARIENIKDYIKDTAPDVLLLQEIKTQNENFPNDEFKKLGFTSYVFGQKSYNGVAIISKHELSNVNNNFIKDDLNQSRVITAELKLKKKDRNNKYLCSKWKSCRYRKICIQKKLVKKIYNKY